MKYGFVGCGEMGSAIVSGIVNESAQQPNDILVFDSNKKAQNKLTVKYGVIPCEDLKELITRSDRVIFSVKPDVLLTLLPLAGEILAKKDSAVISVVAGVSIEQIEKRLPLELPVVRIMPNINVSIASGVLGVCCNKYVSDICKNEIIKTFSYIGKVIEIPQEHFDIFTVIASSAPAFVYSFIEALALSGVKHGLKKEVALSLAAGMVEGSAKMAGISKEHPLSLADKVCSPGGVTIEGIIALKEDGFESSIINAVEKSMNKIKGK